MRAAFYDRQGPPEDVLHVGELPDPTPGPGEVRVAITVSAVNPSDLKAMSGSRANAFDRVVPQSDGAGVIDEVGDGVDPRRVGERVWVYEAQWGRPFGTAAEWVVVEAPRAIPLGAEVSDAAGASVGIPALTAHRCLYAGGDPKGLTVLVTGASGRVGWYAVQLAQLAGAQVLATGGGDEGCAAASTLGVEVFDHLEPGLPQQILRATAGAGVDLVVDVEFGHNLSWLVDVARPNASIATYSSMLVPEPVFPFYPMMRKNLTLRCVLVYSMPEQAKRDAVAAVSSALDHGRLQHRVGFETDLDRVLDAYRTLRDGAVRGTVLVSTRQHS